MSASARSTGGGRQAAARSEKKKAAQKTADWNGAKLKLPPKLPPTIGLDLGRIDAMERRGEATLGALYELLESLIGDVGMSQVRTVIQNGGGKKYGAIDGRLYTDVLDAVMEAYGTKAGESSASTAS